MPHTCGQAIDVPLMPAVCGRGFKVELGGPTSRAGDGDEGPEASGSERESASGENELIN